MADPIYLTVVMPERVVGMTATVPVGGLSMAPATTEEMEAGTETALRSMSPALVKSAIEKLAPPPDPDFLLMNFPPEDEGMPFLETDWGENRNIRFVA